MVHIHGQSDSRTSLSIPRINMRRNFLGSIPSRPEAGQPEEQSPHVKQRLKFPSGKSFLTSSRILCCTRPSTFITTSAIIFSFLYKYKAISRQTVTRIHWVRLNLSSSCRRFARQVADPTPAEDLHAQWWPPKHPLTYLTSHS